MKKRYNTFRREGNNAVLVTWCPNGEKSEQVICGAEEFISSVSSGESVFGVLKRCL